MEENLNNYYNTYFAKYQDEDSYKTNPIRIHDLMLDVESIIGNLSSKTELDRNFEGLDASHIWIPYWISSVMDMFNTKFVFDNRARLFKLITYFVKRDTVSKDELILKCSNLT